MVVHRVKIIRENGPAVLILRSACGPRPIGPILPIFVHPTRCGNYCREFRHTLDVILTLFCSLVVHRMIVLTGLSPCFLFSFIHDAYVHDCDHDCNCDSHLPFILTPQKRTSYGRHYRSHPMDLFHIDTPTGLDISLMDCKRNMHAWGRYA